MTIPWVTVWGFGADIKSAGDFLFVREKGRRDAVRYPFDSFTHLLIAGDNLLHTGVIEQCAKHKTALSFFDAHGNPAGSLFERCPAPLAAVQECAPAHTFALNAVSASIDSRLRFLHEISEKFPALYYQGEFEIISETRSQLEYLITLPELVRAFVLTKSMYYEILSRAVPDSLGYHRRVESLSADPVNVLFSFGYSILYATAALACAGAGLDLSRGNLYGRAPPLKRSQGACVFDIMEPAMAPMVDRVVIGLANDSIMSGNYESAGPRCILSNELRNEFMRRLSGSIDRQCIEENVGSYAAALQTGAHFIYHFPA